MVISLFNEILNYLRASPITDIELFKGVPHYPHYRSILVIRKGTNIGFGHDGVSPSLLILFKVEARFDRSTFASLEDFGRKGVIF